jgi:hypothetical protein
VRFELEEITESRRGTLDIASYILAIENRMGVGRHTPRRFQPDSSLPDVVGPWVALKPPSYTALRYSFTV